MKFHLLKTTYGDGFFGLGFIVYETPTSFEIGVQLVKWIFSVQFSWAKNENQS